MRYAVISDIHSNLEALKAFLNETLSLGIDKTVCLGDIVGYNASPNECIELVKRHKFICIMGNHDSRAAGLEEPFDFNFHAAAAVYWTRQVITEDNREFLKILPRKLTVNNSFLAVHGWINDTDQYIIGANSAMENFKLLKGLKDSMNLCFFGHTHVPITYAETDGTVVSNAEDTFKIKKKANYLINPGGLGQPRDRDPRAAFLIYDTKKSEVSFRRVEYDVQTTAEKIIAAGLPERLAERLKLGW
ncbi:MAG: metallophosphoesterase family protein [Deltaproteobacteria bacterium]